MIHDNDSPEQALQYSNLFSRFLSKPVLSQKWGILQLLYRLSDAASSEPPSSQQRSDPRFQQNGDSHFGEKQGPLVTSKTESLVYDDAFARPGLPTLLSPEKAFNNSRRSKLASSASPEATRYRPLRRVDGNVPEAQEPATPFAQSRYSPSESSLLRDLPFVLQGVSSSNMTFSLNDTLKMPHTLPAPIISLLHSLAEPALLYKGLSRFQESSEGDLIGQSLRAALGIEMRSYLSLVASLESQIRRALAILDDSDSRQAVAKAGVTLRRCVIWTREATMGLRLMSLIVDESKMRKGGRLISLIHSFASSHGDPFVGAFAERLLSHTTRPFYDMLRLWIYDGELSDPHTEFFVIEQHPKDEHDGRGAATSVWEDKYKLDDAMVPSIITSDFARKVFLIGKSLNFIRYGCGDSAWVEEYSKSASRELRYGDTATLETSIDEAYKTTMARLIHLMNTKFKLLEHLTALKKYLLLGQGDFVALLMESLASNLDRPANSQYRHTLTAQLEHTIRNSNAQHDGPDVLRRLDARMLELSHGEIGWDVFTLEYKVDAPVDVIVNAHGSKQYLKVFNFLWRVKRVEFALGVTWRRCMTGARGVLAAAEADALARDWKTARCVVAEMVHFVVQLQYYILFEVIESSWAALQRDMARPGATLDDLISAHAKYLRCITRKGLLGAGSSLDFTSQLHELLKIMLAYKDAVEGLYSYSVNESTQRQQQEARIDARTRQGRWGVTERDDDEYLNSAADSRAYSPPPLLVVNGAEGAAATGAEGVLPALRQRLSALSLDFRARVCGLLGDLAYQPDPDMRFLGVVMNFNDTYKIVKRSRRREGVGRRDDGGSRKDGGDKRDGGGGKSERETKEGNEGKRAERDKAKDTTSAATRIQAAESSAKEQKGKDRAER